jgi:hypothetical protein
MRKRGLRLLTVAVALALVAAACGDDDEAADDGGATTTTAATDEGGGETTTTAAATDDGSAEDSGEEGGGAGEIYEDPRGGIFAEFQTGFDRTHPFQSLEEFCVPHDAAELTDSDDGITAEAISLVHIRSKLEQLEGIGFAVPIGQPTDMFDAFAAAINDCGGIRGRQVELQTVEVDVFNAAVDIDAQRNAACIEATEDLGAVIVLNTTGFQGSANLCLVEDAGVAFISSQGQSEEFMARGEDLLYSFGPTLEESLRFLAQDLIDSGALEGRTIGVVAADTPGQTEAVEAGLVSLLEDAGLEVAAFDVIGCAGSSTCVQGIPESVSGMLSAGVDVLFPTLNVVSLPQYITEMVAQGFEPGDVQFYNSDFNSQAGELVASKVVQFGGTDAGDLYNGAIIVDSAPTGGYREADFAVTPFEAMCHATYAAYSPAGLSYEPEEKATSGAYGMTVAVCAQMRMAARAIYDAGDNPTRQDVYDALANLGPIDWSEMLVGSVRPGKTQIPDAIHTLEFEFPCTKPFPYGEEQVCITPTDEYRPAPR